MKDFLKKYWWFILIILLSPVAINYMLLFPAIGPVVGDNVHWLSFWGSYLAALLPTVGAFMILYIQRRDSLGENEKRRKENEDNRNLQINILKYQQEMQWLNDKKQIVINSALTLGKDSLRELSYLMGLNRDILPEIKILFEKLVKSDSDIDFMIVPMKTKEYYSFIKNRKDAYNIYRDALLDIQEINQVFVRSQQMSRRGEFRKRLERGLISQRLQTIAQSYWVEEAFLNESPSIIADKIISHLPPLMENIRNSAFEYIKSEEERISQLLK